jgi:hypothetical protein
MRTVLLIALAALPACTTYARIARTNAPAVVDLSVPPEHENGSDELYGPLESEQPGAESYVAWLMPAFGGGLVRHGTGMDLSVGLAIERDHAGGGGLGVANKAWGGAIGMDIIQFHSDQQATMITNTAGPFWVEAYRRKTLVMIGGGPVVYSDTHDVGAQITVHGPLVQARVRWTRSSGFEATFGYELPLPAVFAWSR